MLFLATSLTLVVGVTVLVTGVWRGLAGPGGPLGRWHRCLQLSPRDSCANARGRSRCPFTQSRGLEHLNQGNAPQVSPGQRHQPGLRPPAPAQSPPRRSPAPALPPQPRRPPLGSQRAPVSSAVRCRPPLPSALRDSLLSGVKARGERPPTPCDTFPGPACPLSLCHCPKALLLQHA